ncbi:MAG: molybdopterin biosynthesis protein [Desulfomicrobium sp.]|nr:molybdopterin biosynthesis protein [Pseudomonadota bacterium]MBV1713687.1 molybdopterin biosynthesis protein [Desulfomicrobium sp.]MBU4572223.1 molybdopterin biosynthesis protein [Pseudomonadota bacterium]MBU4594201.1 molybdopterin biosynthesis protein [Pseudomonadota bacterium]MBV1720848.1 molybdopterin biosynthesis protein [Desulfomicrobium sp.]
MEKRNIYLKTLPVAEALRLTMEALDRDRLVGTETIPAQQACGRVTAQPVYAVCSSPTFHSAAMDGYALKAESTFLAREGRPVLLAKGTQCRPVNTGHPLPEGMDGVLMIEKVVRESDEAIEIETPVFPMQHVRRIGEDIVATELLLPQNRLLSPYDVGGLLSAGIWDVPVREQLRMAFIPTGDEVLDFTTRPNPKPGQVIESNSQVFAGLAAAQGCLFTRVDPVPDNEEALTAAVREAVSGPHHVVVIGAGSSAGSKDFSRSIIERLGRVLVHGIDLMPGKPSILGVIEGKLVVGAPGYPVSAVVCFEELLIPLLSWLSRKTPPVRQTVEVELARKVPSKLGTEELVRLAIGRVGDKFVATPLGRGAGMLTTLIRAQGMTRIPVESEGAEAASTVRAELLVPAAELDQTLVVVGSHDNILDVLGNEFMGLERPVRIASSHVGSMGGLTALKNRSALMAGTHLFDEDSGDFNFPFFRKYLPGLDVACVNLAIRHQGLIVAKGNPLGITGVGDLARPEVRFINRQRGAGTRILLDYHLRQAGIGPEQVNGYEKEEFTHMAVAVNVLTGTASCGLGIFAAANALGLDFVPLARERYDLAFLPELADWKIETALELIRSRAFKERIEALGGYETTLTGMIMEPGQGLG